ncbi:hypothetical protein BJ508DRAFT_345983 [Ascobolus immersus RN42]|uniref:C2H2-type domain-containing protein n=1 Tax=Ascobolus immersus RN42 TaxID=1160509 RepID=A0A3N4HEY3_ASCIM|nr:hypothetical protein BJ508DRAFT_345983 [Ascobolus immersus RN42]
MKTSPSSKEGKLKRVCKDYRYMDSDSEDEGCDHYECSYNFVFVRIICYDITVFRAEDSQFYCPIEGCDYSIFEGTEFVDHCKGHSRLRNAEIVLKSAVLRMSKNPQTFIYSPTVDLHKSSLAPRQQFNAMYSTPKQSKTAVTAPASTVRPRQPISATPQNARPMGPGRQSANKRKAPEDTSTEDLRASLVVEYRKQIHAEMMRAMADPEANLDESSKRRQKLKAWFDEGMEMLKETDMVL